MREGINSNVDGINDDQLSPDFEEFEADYLDLEVESEVEILEDEDSRYCEETQDDEFYIDLDGQELDF